MDLKETLCKNIKTWTEVYLHYCGNWEDKASQWWQPRWGKSGDSEHYNPDFNKIFLWKKHALITCFIFKWVYKTLKLMKDCSFLLICILQCFYLDCVALIAVTLTCACAPNWLKIEAFISLLNDVIIPTSVSIREQRIWPGLRVRDHRVRVRDVSSSECGQKQK